MASILIRKNFNAIFSLYIFIYKELLLSSFNFSIMMYFNWKADCVSQNVINFRLLVGFILAMMASEMANLKEKNLNTSRLLKVTCVYSTCQATSHPDSIKVVNNLNKSNLRSNINTLKQ